MTKASRIIKKAKEFIGVQDTPLGSKNIIFNDVFYGENERVNWNLSFLWYLFRICDASELFFYGEKPKNVEEFVTYYRSTNQISDKIKPGNLIVYKNGFIGLITDVKSDITYEIIIADMCDSSKIEVFNTGYTTKDVLSHNDKFMFDCFIVPNYFPENVPEEKGGDKPIKVLPDKK